MTTGQTYQLGSGGAGTTIPPDTPAANSVSITGGSNYGASSGTAAPNTPLTFTFAYHDTPNGASGIQAVEIELPPPPGYSYPFCDVEWGPQYALTMYDQGGLNTIQATGNPPTVSDSFCTVSSPSITYSSTDSTLAWVTFNLTFTGLPPASYQVSTRITDSDGTSNWGTVGSWTEPATQALTPPPSSSYQLDSVPYTETVFFNPRPTGDTLAVTQTPAPVTSRGNAYQFSTLNGSLPTQFIEAPPQGQQGGNGCPWTCSGGSCSSPVPVGQPQPKPVISSVTLDAAEQVLAVLYPGVPTTIYINGSSFGNAAGFAQFCTAGGTPCNFSTVVGYLQTPVSWSNSQIVETVTLDPATPLGAWLIYLSVPFWISGSDYANPSMGNLEVDAPPPGPAYMLVLNDVTDNCTGCSTTARRTFDFQVMLASGQPWSGPTGTGGTMCENLTHGTTTCTPGTYASTSACNSPPDFVPMGADGKFTDQWSFNSDNFTPAGCGYTTSDVWNAIAGAPPSYLTPVGLLAGFLHTDAIQVNGTTSTPGSSGQLTNKCINSTGTIPSCPN